MTEPKTTAALAELADAPAEKLMFAHGKNVAADIAEAALAEFAKFRRTLALAALALTKKPEDRLAKLQALINRAATIADDPETNDLSDIAILLEDHATEETE